MTREIKFRAKRIDDGRWAYGYFVKTPITTEFNCDGQYLDSGGPGRYCIVQDSCAHDIDIKTLGQSTGLHDKKGGEIYEGDILEINLVLKRITKKIVREVEWGVCGFGPKTMGKGKWEIIGNIYQNDQS